MEQLNQWKQIGNRLSACRQNKNMTQEEFAGRLGITPQALSKWERGVSYPDISMLEGISRILEVSTDYLLGVVLQDNQHRWSAEEELQRQIGDRISTACESLELIFSMELVPAFQVSPFAEKVVEIRKRLAGEGMLLPVVRLRDMSLLKGHEFMVLSCHNVLYSGTVETVDENTVGYMLEKLEMCVREKYYEILNPDIIKSLVDNLRCKYPALIDGVVPERISYGLLADVARNVLRHGDGICYLPKMIEVIDHEFRESERMGSRPSVEELVNRIRHKIEREDNLWVMIGKMREAEARETENTES